MKIVLATIVALLLLIGGAEAKEAKGKVKGGKSLITKYGYCSSKNETAWSCGGNSTAGNCNVAVKQPDRSFRVYYVTHALTPIANQQRRAQAERVFSYKDITCVARDAQVKAVQDCGQQALKAGIQGHCNVARQSKGRLIWYRVKVTVADDPTTKFVESVQTGSRDQ